MCDCEISVGITEVPLLHGETVLEDFQGEGGCCGCSCECCPKEYGRLTNRRIIVLQKRTGVLHSTALLEDVTACAVGRKRPNWWAILSLFIVGVSVVGGFSAVIDDVDKSYDCRKRGDCDVPPGLVIMVLLGLMMMGLAVFIYFARPTTITFFVKGSTNSDNGFSLVIASRGLAMEVLGRYFAAKAALNATIGTPVGHVLAADPTPATHALGQRFEPVNIHDLHCVRVAEWRDHALQMIQPLRL